MESRIVQGSISPINAADINLVAKEHTVHVPVDVPGVFVPSFVPDEQVWLVTDETRTHAQTVARKFVEQLSQLPHTPEVGDLLALVFTVLHKEKK